MNILDQIKAHKTKEVQERASLYPIKLLERSVFFEAPCVSMKQYISAPHRSGIIAEFKRQSPSKGIINKYADVQQVTLGYMQAGAAALSVLTDTHFFGARPTDLPTARKFNYCPILRKDFILNEYQIVEAKSMGADVILLIASMLNPTELRQLSAFAHGLGLEVFLETHTEHEIANATDCEPDLIGINNRNLQSFEVNVERSIQLAEVLPADSIKVAESGITDAATIRLLKQHGFSGFLIGELFMRSSNPAVACQRLIKSISHEN